LSLLIGVDLGATKVRVALGNESGIRSSCYEETDKSHGTRGIIDQIARMIRSLLPEGIIPETIGIGSIGPLDFSSGSIRAPPNLPFKIIPLRKPLQEEFGVPIYLMNDCTVAVLGEHTFGAARDLENVVYVTISTGIGGGAIVDGHLLIGKDGNAVEVGHITVNPEGTMTCGCGCRGHWEAYCSGANIPNYARYLLSRRDPEDWSTSLLQQFSGGDPQHITTEILFKATKNGDRIAQWIVERIGEINAIGFADLVNLFDPELITVGGSVALNNPDLILHPILKNIRKHTINRVPEICITPLGDEVVLYGALALARQRRTNSVKTVI
jgi:glucokinase